jgi:hypothetical protein
MRFCCCERTLGIRPSRECARTPKKRSNIKSGIGFSALRSPSVLAKSAQVSRVRVRGKTIVYENRTKSAQSGGLETNWPRERISDLSRRGIVRRSSGEARSCWASIQSRKPAENVGREGLAVDVVNCEPLSGIFSLLMAKKQVFSRSATASEAETRANPKTCEQIYCGPYQEDTRQQTGKDQGWIRSPKARIPVRCASW